jgi:hypothetical protein
VEVELLVVEVVVLVVCLTLLLLLVLDHIQSQLVLVGLLIIQQVQFENLQVLLEAIQF